MTADSSQRSHLRDSHGPRAVDAAQSRGSSRRQHREQASDDRRSRRTSEKPSSKTESGHRRKSSTTQSASKPAARPSFDLEVYSQPPVIVAFGMVFETSVSISLRYPAADRLPSPSAIDTSRLLAVASLVVDRPSGERVAVESGFLTGQKLFDSVHPDENLMARSEPCRVVLGGFGFSGLLIRQPGTYRIRTTLIQMPALGSAAQGGSTVLSVDSEPVRVERRPSGLLRTQQRVYA